MAIYLSDNYNGDSFSTVCAINPISGKKIDLEIETKCVGVRISSPPTH